MFFPADREILDLMLGEGQSTDALLKEYMLRLRLSALGGKHGSMGIDGLVNVVRHCKLVPAEMDLSKSRINWRMLDQDTLVRHVEDQRVGKFVYEVMQGSIAVRFGDGEIEEIPARLLEMAPPELPAELSEQDKAVIKEEDQGDIIDNLPETPFALDPPDWKKVKKGDELYAKIDEDMHDVVLQSKVPGPKRCTVIVEGVEKVLDREQVFLPV